MRTLTVHAILVVAFAVQPAMSQHQMGHQSEPPDITMPEGADSVTVPLQASGNHVIVPVSINGSDPLPMILDTGMPIPGVLLFDGDHIESLSLEYSPVQAQVGGAGGDGKHLEARVATGLKLSIGGIAIADQRALVMPPIEHFSLPHAGVIGLTVLQNFTVGIDYDRDRFVLSRPGTGAPPEGSTEIPLEFEGNLPYVKAGVIQSDGKEVAANLVLDLGANHAVSLNAGSSDTIHFPEETLGTRIGRGVSGEVRGRVGRIAGFTLGGHRLDNVLATFPDAQHEHPRGVDSRDGNLGMDILNRFNMTFDYAARTLHIVPNKSFDEPFEWDMSGISTDPGNQKGLKVAEVVKGSPAAEAGLKKGDLLVAVDGEPISGEDGVTVRDKFMKDGAAVSVSFLRDGKEMTAELKLRRLI